MRKSILAILLLSPLLAGCITLSDLSTSILYGGASVTASIDNPVTPTKLYEAENALTVAVSGMLAYKRTCAKRAIPSSCRKVVALLQSYTAQAKPLLISSRRFVRENDQVNAIKAFNEARLLVEAFRQTSAVYSVGAQ
jgi:hypothetical protein